MSIPQITGILFPELFKVHRDLEAAMNHWRQTALVCQPTLNADYVRTVCEEVVRRAHLLGQTTPVDFNKLVHFFLSRSSAWIMGGLPVGSVGAKLPKTMDEIGYMIMQEGINVHTGMPLTQADLKHASINGRLKIQ